MEWIAAYPLVDDDIAQLRIIILKIMQDVGGAQAITCTSRCSSLLMNYISDFNLIE